MAIILNLPPDLEAALRAEAQEQGKAPEVLAVAHLAALYAARRQNHPRTPELLWKRTGERGGGAYLDEDDERPRLGHGE
jgi:hypothetical protein